MEALCRSANIIEVEHDGELGTGIVTAVRDGRALVQLTIISD